MDFFLEGEEETVTDACTREQSVELTSAPAHDSRQCPLCAHRQFRELETPGHPIGRSTFGPYLREYKLCRCGSPECGLVFINPRPSSELLGRFYSSKTYDCHQARSSSANPRKAQWLLQLVAKHGPYSEERRFLDFGCGGGYLLHNAIAAGWSGIGFDPGAAAIQTCRQQGLPATGSIQDLKPSSFDVIVMNHVFEHVEQPEELLALLRSLLKPQCGKLFIEVPNVKSLRARLSLPFLSKHFEFDERHRAFPIHLWYFSSVTLPLMLQKGGFQVDLVTTSGMGIEELRIRNTKPGSPADATSPEVPRKSSLLQPVKSVVKTVFLNAGLGENLVAVAHPNGQQSFSRPPFPLA